MVPLVPGTPAVLRDLRRRRPAGASRRAGAAPGR